jgi:hypothetical protein
MATIFCPALRDRMIARYDGFAVRGGELPLRYIHPTVAGRW